MLKQTNGYIRGTSMALLVAYLSFLSWRMFFYAYGSYQRIPFAELEYNLIPLRTIMGYLKHFHSYDFHVWIYNLLGNVIVFIPLGFLLTFVFRRYHIKKVLGIAFLIIATAELIQLFLRVGVFDVDDILLNMLGCLIGAMIGFLLRKKILQF